MDISIVVPSFNAIGKLERCLRSLQAQTYDVNAYEVVFVDDCSSDGTYEYLQKQALARPNWRVLQLDKNSGSPSKPRNVGTAEAKGEFIFFLDCDDEILPDTLQRHYDFAQKNNACVVRGYLIADDGKNQELMNQLPDWHAELTKAERIEKIISKQSTTVPSLIKRDILTNNAIVWPENIRVGEDSVFLCELLAHCERIEYINHPTFIYNRRASFQLSSTQEYGSRELNNHIVVWKKLIEALAKVGLDYVSLRLRVGLQTAVRSLIFQSKQDISEQDFLMFSAFIHQHWHALAQHRFASHIQDVVNAVQQGNYVDFIQRCKPRLLIAGHDLKFIAPILPQLEQFYQIRIDEWTGHNTHDALQSEQLLKWADYIWCEWLLGNAVWYSERKMPHQKLIIRMHRFELGRDFGEQIVIDNVDAVVAVSLLFFERLLERFPNIPRHKAKLMHNYVDIDGYSLSDAPERQFTLAMIGIVPFRKGFHHSIELLNQLTQHDKRYKLKIFGKGPQDIPWLKNHPDEMAYYQACIDAIAQYQLEQHVEFLGHCDIKTALAEHNVGYVLSLSENSPGFPGPESFHLAIADGFAAGIRSLVLNWAGAEYIYDAEHIFSSVEAIKTEILSGADNASSVNVALRGQSLMLERYSVTVFTSRFRNLYLG